MMTKNPYSSPTNRRLGKRGWMMAVAVTGIVLLFFVSQSGGKTKKRRFRRAHDRSKPKQPLRIAFVGNSYLFTNDSPGLLVKLLEASGKYDVMYECCMEAGSSLLSIRDDRPCNPGLTISSYHGTDSLSVDKLLDPLTQSWDFVILNDQSRAPTISYRKKYTIERLNETYSNEFWGTGATPIFLQTSAYRDDIPEALGTFEEFTNSLRIGYQQYASVLTENFQKREKANASTDISSSTTTTINTEPPQKRPQKALVSPVGEAFARVKMQNEELWGRLYMMEDGKHPSPLGTWLQVCVLYATLTNEEPPQYDVEFWKTGPGRYRTSGAIPTKKDALELWTVALQTTGIMDDQFFVAHD